MLKTPQCHSRVAAFLSSLCLAVCLEAQTTVLTTLFKFSSPGGQNPGFGNLIADDKGDLYGALSNGGEYSCGSIFRLSPPSGISANWREVVLYVFQNPYGCNPAALVRGVGGVLYGITSLGGTFNQGTVFELSPPTRVGSAWTENVLYSFGSTNGDVGQPVHGNIIVTKKGTIYGEATNGGTENEGGVFELTPPSTAGSPWTETVIYNFTAGDPGGDQNGGGLVMGSLGQLYGTTESGGVNNLGLIFELQRNASGQWVERDLHSFEGPDGSLPITSLLIDAAGSLYGTTFSGGPSNSSCYFTPDGCGTVFQLVPPAKSSGSWTLNTLHFFGGAPGDGSFPWSGLLADASGNLFGTASTGGLGSCTIYFSLGCGTVFEISPPSSGSGPWTETVLYQFTGGADGAFPLSALVIGLNADLYGTTNYGGDAQAQSGSGTVFRLVP